MRHCCASLHHENSLKDLRHIFKWCLLYSGSCFLNAEGLDFGAGCLNDESAVQSCMGNGKLLAISTFPKSSVGNGREQNVCHSN